MAELVLVSHTMGTQDQWNVVGWDWLLHRGASRISPLEHIVFWVRLPLLKTKARSFPPRSWYNAVSRAIWAAQLWWTHLPTAFSILLNIVLKACSDLESVALGYTHRSISRHRHNQCYISEYDCLGRTEILRWLLLQTRQLGLKSDKMCCKIL